MILYPTLTRCRFLYRVNRFLAMCELEGAATSVHVKNTGRLRELLLPGAEAWLAPADNPLRKTAWDLVAVENGGRTVNIDSQAPNAIAAEWLAQGGYGPGVTEIRREVVHGDSRFDFAFSHNGTPVLMEVKGVTLFDEEGTAYFPDAPTDRGIKHLRGLAEAAQAGMETAVCFVVQREDVNCLRPNPAQPAFCEALKMAGDAGVRLIAAACRVTPEEVAITHTVPVMLD